MAMKTDAEKLAAITRYCRDLQALSADEAPGTMTPDERTHWEAVNLGYHFASENILNIIDHGTTRPKRTPKETP
jgi:hypothetical protein